MNEKSSTLLPAPFVSVANPRDGLINISELASPIEVRVTVPPYPDHGDRINLTVNQLPLLTGLMLSAEHKSEDFVTLQLPNELLAIDGIYEVGYRYLRSASDVEIYSSELQLKVDRTPPGATLLAPLIFPSASFGDQLIGLLPGYAGMEPGDLIQTLCNGIPGPTHTVGADELTLRPIEIAFERQHLQTLGADTVLIEYQVTDRAGNSSVTSLPVLMTIKL